MSITLITPHQRPNSGGVQAIEQLARHAAKLTEVHLVVAKGECREIAGVIIHGPETLADLAFPAADALIIPADLPNTQPLFSLAPEQGVPMLLLQGFGAPGDHVVRANLSLAAHCICTSAWLVSAAEQAGCTSTLLRYGLDREVFLPGPPTEGRGQVVSMMTHRLDWKGTEDGLAALRLVREEFGELEVRLFGKGVPDFDGASYLPSPNQLPEVAELLRASAVFVCSSWEEGFGLPGIEAIASGAALATTDTKGSRDYAESRRTALVTPPRDPCALADSIAELLGDPALRKTLVTAGQRRIDAVYPSWPRAAELFVERVDAATASLRRLPGLGARRGPSHKDETELEIQRQLDRAVARRRNAERRAAAAQRRAEQAETESEAALGRLRDERRRSRRRARDLELKLVGELDETRDALHQAQREAAASRAELARLSSELELAGLQRRRLQAALARARADAQVAESERAAIDRQLTHLMVDLPPLPGYERAGNGAHVDHQPVASLALPTAAWSWPPLAPSEQATQERFTAIYAAVADDLSPDPHGVDPLALALPADRHGMLVARGENQSGPAVDVVVCVHNALEDVRRCLWSLLHKASRPFRLIVVDDGSSEPTSSFLERLAEQLPKLTLLRRSAPPHGYTLAANTGLRESAGDYVVLLNSDTVVTYHWLERIVAEGERDPSIGLLGPLSNAATHQSIPERRLNGGWAANALPDWLTEDGMALLVARATPRTAARLPFLNGFCYVIRRAVLDRIGLLDEERFAPGYAEENDYSQRARDAGFQLAVVDDAYVFHARSRSYGTDTRAEIARSGYQTFLERHGADKINELVRSMEADTTLDSIRHMVANASASPQATAGALRGAIEDRLSVAFVLPGIADGGSGGSHSVYQEVHGLRQLGAEARIMLAERDWDRARAVYSDAPQVFDAYADDEQLAAKTAAANVIVATHFKSVAALRRLRELRDDFLPGYYIQDYEAMFDFGDPADNDEAAASYTALPDALLFAKTHWLCNVVARRHGVFVAKVEPSLDTGVFHARGRADAGSGPLRITAMVRPRTPRRQPYSTTAVLERLAEELAGEVHITTFGCRDDDLERVTQAGWIRTAHLGLLSRERVADLMRRTDVFLDLSTYQAFGRTALEAMACGCTAVLPGLGGVWEFAKSGQNALLVDTRDRDASYAALASLVRDRDRVKRFQDAAIETASRYSVARAALSEYVVMLHAYEARFG